MAAPAVCDKCGLVFDSPFGLGGGGNITIMDCGTNCPKCNGHARVLNSFSDSQGNIHVQGLFSVLRDIKDTQKLSKLKKDIEETGDNLTPTELVRFLSGVDSRFESFEAVIKQLSPSSFKKFLDTVVPMIMMLIVLLQWQSSDENYDEEIELQKEQIQISQSIFEYQKQQDNRNDALEKKMEDLENEFAIILEQESEPYSRLNKQITNNWSVPKKSKVHAKKKSTLKGNFRNKPCLCGSGKKSKKCHPDGY